MERGTPNQRESVLDVLAPLFLWQIDLRGRVARAPKQLHDRHSQMTRKIGCLVESAFVFASGMKRHRNHHVRVLQQRMSTLAHQRAEPRRYRVPALVLERVDDFLHAPVVVIDGAGPRHGVIGREMFVKGSGKPQACPAVFADRAIERMEQPLPASGTRRLENR